MIRKAILVFSMMLCMAGANAADTNLLHFPATGFSIAALDAPPGENPQQALAMYLPPTGTFAANVNVMIQPYDGTIEDYLNLSLDQFKKLDFTLIQKKLISATSISIEYSGSMKGSPFHWYAKAQKSGGKVYLVTATSFASDWKTQSEALKKCVDSFKCDKP